MVWESQVEYLNPLLAGNTIIHGHRPITFEYCEKQVNGNKQVINIDTGCVYKEKVGYRRLTPIELYSKKLFSVYFYIFVIRESRIENVEYEKA